jgi:hypothetical protein
VREMQELRKRKAEEEAQLKAEEAAKAAQQSFNFQLEDQPENQPGVPHPERSEGWDRSSILPKIHAVADSSTSTRKIERPPCHRRRKHNTRRGNPVGQQPLDHPLQPRNRSRRHLQEESIPTGHVVTLLHLRQVLHKLEEGMIPRPVAGHANDRQNRCSERLSVNLNRVAADDSGILHPPQSLGRSRS